MNASRLVTFLILVFILIALLGILYFASQSILGASFVQLEEQSAERNVGRAQDALQNDLDELSSKVGDWANWDDAYDYVQTGDPEFIRINATDVTFQQLKIDFIIFLKPSGEVVYGRAFDYDVNKPVAFPTGLSKLLRDKQALKTILQNDPTSTGLTGLVLIPEDTLLLAARPILTSNGEGPVHGTLIFARHIDDLEIAQLAARIHLALSLDRTDQPASSDDFRPPAENLSTTNPIFVRAPDEKTVYGYGLINDIFGKPGLTLRVEIARDIYQQGQATIRYFMLVMFVVGICFLGISQLLLDRLVLSSRSQRETQARYQTVIERAAEGIAIIDADTTGILDANPAFLNIFGYSANEISGLRLLELVAEPINPSAPETLSLEPFTGAGNYHRKDGSELEAEASTSVISQNSHKVMSVIIRDVTARNQRQREIHQRAKEFALLYDAGIALNSQLEPGKTLENLLRIVSEIVQAYEAVFFRYDAPLGIFRYQTGHSHEPNPSSNIIEALSFPFGEERGIVGLIAAEHKPIYIPDLDKDPRWIKTGSPENSALWTPVMRGDELLGALMVTSLRFNAFAPTDQRLITLLANQLAVAMDNARLFQELDDSYLQTVVALARAVDAKDSYTGDHSDRLAEMAMTIGRTLGIDGRELADLHYGAILHDIGKIGVADSILKKPAPLTNAEWAEMRRHPEIGEQILAAIPRLAGAAKIVRYHHERYDGKGYPDQLTGEEIPVGARILTIVDSYSAIVDERVYKRSKSKAEAIAELKRCSGTQFDPEITRVFLKLFSNEEHSIPPPEVLPVAQYSQKSDNLQLVNN